MADMQDTFQFNDLLKILLILLGVYLLINMTSEKKEPLTNVEPYSYEEMYPTYEEPTYEEPSYEEPSYEEPTYEPVQDYGIYEGLENVKDTNSSVVQPISPEDQFLAPVTSEQQVVDQVVAGKQQLNADDLLPKYDEANEFAKQNPVSKLLKEQNFLISGYHVGINTVMQSNKIPYHDLRSAPPIPKESVGPWSQSSFEVPAGAGRRYFELN